MGERRCRTATSGQINGEVDNAIQSRSLPARVEVRFRRSRGMGPFAPGGAADARDRTEGESLSPPLLCIFPRSHSRDRVSRSDPGASGASLWTSAATVRIGLAGPWVASFCQGLERKEIHILFSTASYFSVFRSEEHTS